MKKGPMLYKCLCQLAVFMGDNCPIKQSEIGYPLNILTDTNMKRLRMQMHKQVDDLMDMAERTYEE